MFKSSIGTSFWWVNAFSNLFAIVRAAGDQEFAVRKDVDPICRSESPTFFQRVSNTGIFPVKLAEFLRALILKNIYQPLLLYLQVISFTMHGQDAANET